MKSFRKFIVPFLMFGLAVIQTSAAPGVKINPVGRLVEILPPHQEFNWNISLTGLAPGETVSWQVLDWNGKAATPSTALPIQAAGTTIAFKPARLGWEDLVVSVRGTDGAIHSETHRGFVSGETRKLGPDDFKYGICCHLRPNDIYPANLEVLDKLGVVYLRDDFSFGRAEPAEGKWDWTFIDGMVADMEKRGVQIDAILGYTVKWASTQPAAPNAERVAPRLDPWLTYVRTMVGRYQGRIRYWEIWNEEDISFWQSPPEDFLKLFSETAKTIKATNSQAVVLNGGFAMISRTPNLTFLDDFLPRADRSNWDVFAYHDYHTFANQLERRKKVSATCSKYHIDLPVWMNEGGISSVGAGDRTQAVTLVKKLATAPSLGLQSYFVYDLHNDGVDPINNEHNFGLVSFDFAAKPSFGAYQNLIRLLGGRKFLRTEHLDKPDIWSQVYAGRNATDDAIAVLWAENLSGGTILAWFEGMKGAHLFDLMGNPLPLMEVAQGSLVEIGNEPVYLQAKGTENWLPRPLLITPPIVALRAGESTPVSLSFTNPLAQSVQLSITESKLSAGLHFAPSVPIDIPAGETRPITVSFQSDASIAPQPAAQLNVSFSGGQSQISLPLGVVRTLSAVNPAAGVIELGDHDGNGIVLNGAESIFNLYSAEPLDEMHWHGPQDLSMTARLGYGNDALYLTFKVTDDIQWQTQVNDKIGLGDSLQVCVAPEATASSYLDLTVALDKTGQPMGWVNGVPAKSTIRPGALSLAGLPCVAHREGTTTVYALKIPWSVLGLAQVPKEPLRLSFLVNDDDGKGRKQWLQLGEGGIAPVRNSLLFPLFICR